MNFIALLGVEGGTVTPDAYNTAWVARVPDASGLHRPAWPQALAYLRTHQLADGGWGDDHVYYAHERTISTLAALLALLEWGEPAGSRRIQRGVEALRRYARDLSREPHEPIGYELLLPRLAVELERFNLDLPIREWEDVERMAAQKVALVGGLQVNYEEPRSWWFNMEMLLECQLAEIDGRILNEHGAIAISPAATAAYLRALRLYQKDCPRAASFLERVLALNGGGAGICYPIEGFQIIWTLDSLMRAGVEPSDTRVKPLLRWLSDYWNSSGNGVSFSRAFPLADGDDTAVAYRVLCWAGYEPSDRPLEQFWESDQQHFVTYADERSSSVSVNVHALHAFRYATDNPAHREKAEGIRNWLRLQTSASNGLRDKWHYSPLYATTRAIPALVGLDDTLARELTEIVLEQQHESGGWGVSPGGSLEETALAILGLVAAKRAGLLPDCEPMRRAATFLRQQARAEPVERLWIGKTLYRPIGVIHAMVSAARVALQLEGVDLQQKYQPVHAPAWPSVTGGS